MQTTWTAGQGTPKSMTTEDHERWEAALAMSCLYAGVAPDAATSNSRPVAHVVPLSLANGNSSKEIAGDGNLSESIPNHETESDNPVVSAVDMGVAVDLSSRNRQMSGVNSDELEPTKFKDHVRVRSKKNDKCIVYRNIPVPKPKIKTRLQCIKRRYPPVINRSNSGEDSSVRMLQSDSDNIQPGVISKSTESDNSVITNKTYKSESRPDQINHEWKTGICNINTSSSQACDNKEYMNHTLDTGKIITSECKKLPDGVPGRRKARTRTSQSKKEADLGLPLVSNIKKETKENEITINHEHQLPGSSAPGCDSVSHATGSVNCDEKNTTHLARRTCEPDQSHSRCAASPRADSKAYHIPLKKRKIQHLNDIKSTHLKTSFIQTVEKTASQDFVGGEAKPESESNVFQNYANSDKGVSDSGEAENGATQKQGSASGEEKRPFAIDPRQSFRMLAECQMALRQDEDGDLPLHIAVVQGNTEMSQKLASLMVMAGKTLDVYNNLRQTPLHLAVLTDQPEIVRCLIRCGACADVQDRHGQSAIHLAVQNNHVTCLQALLPNAIPNRTSVAMNYEGLTALHVAVLLGHNKMVNMLIEHGVSIDVADGKSGRTALFHAAETNNLDILTLLLRNGASVNVVNYSGNTSYQAAIGRGNSEAAFTLSAYGADVSLNRLANDAKSESSRLTMQTNLEENQRNNALISTSKKLIRGQIKNFLHGKTQTTPPTSQEHNLNQSVSSSSKNMTSSSIARSDVTTSFGKVTFEVSRANEQERLPEFTVSTATETCNESVFSALSQDDKMEED